MLEGLAGQTVRILRGGTDAGKLLTARSLRALGRGNDNRASVDTFGTVVAGPVWREGRIFDGEVLRWAASRDRWWRRTALVSTVALNLSSRGGEGDVPRTLMACRELAGDSEPMVSKAFSRALRSLVRVDTGAVASFLGHYGGELPALVRREVRNKLETGVKNPGRKGARQG